MKSLLYKIFLVPVFCVSVHGQSHENSPWHITAKNIDTNNYYGITVANGVVGMVSSPQPLKVEEVILNGVYDYYQRGRVTGTHITIIIMKAANFKNLNLKLKYMLLMLLFIRMINV